MILNGKLEHEELKTLDDAAPYLAPIFGSQASDTSMPTDHFNMDPVEPRPPEPLHLRADLHGARGDRAHEGDARQERHRQGRVPDDGRA